MQEALSRSKRMRKYYSNNIQVFDNPCKDHTEEIQVKWGQQYKFDD